ncbi:MAG: hypothetical protein A2Y10_14520 [Planctomycetes bacterium GWF2_41_51]|nr:MAG: hypothetical protein A2Y10_14520 [Planctomycetes bacterium GWF2_41_51]HBG25507.1 hypothetical protein [Phycisphaerales bacterium]
MNTTDKLTNDVKNVESLSIAKLQLILDSINSKIEQTCNVMPRLLEQIRSTSQTSTYDDSFRPVLQSLSVLRSFIGQIEYWIEKAELNKHNALIENALEQDEISEDEISQILVFISESQDHVESACNGLFSLQTKPNDKDNLNQVFQAFHSIKGMAWFLNLVEIGSLAHSAECLFDSARKCDLVLDSGNIDVVFEAVEMLKEMISDLAVSTEINQPVTKHLNFEQIVQKIKSINSVKSKISNYVI